MIELKNIDLSRVTIVEQLKKIEEEEWEFVQAIQNYSEWDRTDNIIEEFWDCMQSKLGLLQLIGINADVVAKGYNKHLVKLKHRPR